ncbi:MAG: hypothetical protein FJ403_10450 [Verrucomicrobia bacterium]|nr:hypothetical protein [Verrucomicrobiota bacterium]
MKRTRMLMVKIAAVILFALNLSVIRAAEASAALQPPVCKLLSPPDGATFVAPVNIRMMVEAWDPDSTVVSVEYFSGTNSLGILTLMLPPTASPLAASDTIGRPGKAGAVIKDSEMRGSRPCVKLADGNFMVCMPWFKGQKFRVEASADLVHWEVVETSPAAEVDVHFLDTDSKRHGRRYYRVVEAPEGDDDD